MGRRLLQSEPVASLLIDVLRSLVAEHKFELHDFVVMPDHVHLLLTVHEGARLKPCPPYKAPFECLGSLSKLGSVLVTRLKPCPS